ncbi:hypothetical protein [Myroides injenensis]|uniref:hypothetical protein n=1 Tax=Myroides injenensis TaxID=1183151 RepID=UPI000289EC23|nr:hypothetical protein [Myroides injenensis]
MKTTTYLLAFIALSCSAFTSCSSDDNTPVKEIEEQKNEVTIISSTATYLNTSEGKGNYLISLSSLDQRFTLEIISDIVKDEDLLDIDLKSNKYVFSNTKALYTIHTNSSVVDKENTFTLSSGELEINQGNNSSYTIKGSLTDNQNLTYHINYTAVMDIQPKYDVEYEIQNGWYWGDDIYQSPGLGEYMTYFTQGQANSYGELKGDGYHIALSFFDQMAPKAWEAQIPNKTFKAASKRATGTFQVASQEDIDNGVSNYAFAYFQRNDSKKNIEEELLINDGTIKVLEHLSGQEIRFNLQLENGTRHLGKYQGKVIQGDQYTVSKLKADKQVGALNYGYLEYKGKSPIPGKENNRWNIYLYNKGLTAYPQYYWATEGSGEMLRVTIYTPLDDTKDIPTGQYKLGQEIAGNAGQGGGTEAGLDWGTWYFDIEDGDFKSYAPTRTGTVIIKKQGDNYTVELNAIDDRDNNITASYTGALPFVDHNPNTKSIKNTTDKKQKTTKSYNKGKLYDWAKSLKSNK